MFKTGACANYAAYSSASHLPRRPSLAVHTAHSRSQQNMAHLLVGRRYADRGYAYTPPNQANAENQITVNVGDPGMAFGTITVRFDSKLGLHAQEIFGAEIQALRNAGRQVCEFTKLALEEELPSQKVLAALFHMAYIHAHLVRGFDILAVEVNPRHVAYYRRMLGFKVCSPERTNLRVNAPAVLLCVEFEFIKEQIARFGGRPELAGQAPSLFPFAFSPEDEQQIAQRLMQAPRAASSAFDSFDHALAA